MKLKLSKASKDFNLVQPDSAVGIFLHSSRYLQYCYTAVFLKLQVLIKQKSCLLHKAQPLISLAYTLPSVVRLSESRGG